MLPTMIGNDPSSAFVGAAPDAVGTRRRARRAEIKARLTAPEVGPTAAERLLRATESALRTFAPTNAWEAWVVEQIATLQVRISHAQGVERRLRDWAAYRAIDFWADDQQLQVCQLADQLPRHPSKTVARLRQTPTGCDWLIARWAELGLVDAQDWTEEQRTLASHLLGFTSEPAGTHGQTPTAHVANLRAHQARVAEADAITRSLVEASLTDSLGLDFARLQRFERSLLDRLRFFLAQLTPRTPSLPIPPVPPPDETKPLSPPPDETKPLSPPNDETKPLSPLNDETKPLSTRADQDEVDPEPVSIPSATSRIDPGHPAYRQARLDLQKARKRERKARRRGA